MATCPRELPTQAGHFLARRSKFLALEHRFYSFSDLRLKVPQVYSIRSNGCAHDLHQIRDGEPLLVLPSDVERDQICDFAQSMCAGDVHVCVSLYEILHRSVAVRVLERETGGFQLIDWQQHQVNRVQALIGCRDR